MGGWKTRTSEASLASCTDGGSGESSECCGGPAGHRTAARESRQTEPFGVQVISHYFTVRRFGAKTQFSDDPMCQVSLEKCPIRSPLDTPCWRKEQGDALAAWRLRPRRLNLGRTPDMWALGPTRASPGGDLPCVARLRHGNEGRLWAGTQTSGPPARPGVRPGGGGRRCALHYVARPLPVDAFAACCAFGRPGRHLDGPHPSGPSARPGLRPVGGGCSLPYVARPLPDNAFADWTRPPRLRAGEGPGFGPEPTRVGSRSDPGFARQGRSAATRTSSGWAGCIWPGTHPSGLPARPGLRPLGRG